VGSIFFIFLNFGRISKLSKEGGSFMTEEEIFDRVRSLMEKLDKDQELQDLTERNGLDVKSSLRLNPTTKDNVAIAVTALLLAKNSNDPRYTQLVRLGMDHRSLKADLVDAYKAQAQQLIQKYKTSTSPAV
jgi:hypothetical protein